MTGDQRSEDGVTAQSLKDRMGKRLKAAGQPKHRRADRYSKPFRSKPKPEGYVFGRPTLYRPEYCQRAIDFMGQGYSVTALAGHLGMSKDAIYDWINHYPDFCHAINIGRAARVAALEAKLLTTSQGVGVTAAIFALKNAEPEEWQDRYNTTAEVNVDIKKLTDEQIYAMLAKRGYTIEHDAAPQLTRSNERECSD
jgi:hypothetical protein